MTYSARLTVVGGRIKELVEAKINDAVFSDPPIAAVYWGDQIKINDTPAVCVDPDALRREWPPLPHLRTENTLAVNLLVYHARVPADPSDSWEDVKIETDLLAEKLAQLLNVLPTMPDSGGNPLVVHSYVTEISYGIAFKSGTLFHAAAVRWRGMNKTQTTAVE